MFEIRGTGFRVQGFRFAGLEKVYTSTISDSGFRASYRGV
jgi:hypothetical protein